MVLQLTSKKICVVGAGASGLVAARELKKEGHVVVVFERGSQLGGTWVYSPEVEADLLGLDSSHDIVHSSLYHSLRTNIPRETMGFRQFPFVVSGKADRDSRRFPGHQEVLRYLEDFAHEFGLNELIRYQTEVRHVRAGTEGKWLVKYKGIGEEGGSEVDETYDAVVVCSGHYTEPRVATDIPGIDLWPGKQIHSHNYRIPEPYQDKVVVLIGFAPSAVDISRDIVGLAKEVHIATRSQAKGLMFGKHPVYNNLWLHPMIEKTHEDGRVFFQDGNEVLADTILHCTGYKYHFPFLYSGGAVKVDDNRVGPLYKHVFPPALAPGLSFVGIASLVIPFFVCELQSKWIAGVLSGRISLPSKEKMTQDVEALYSELEAKGTPKRDTHKIHDFKRPWSSVFEYEDWLAVQSGSHPSEEWRKYICFATKARASKQFETYRDEWDDEESVLQAHEDFMQYLSAQDKAI